MFLLDKKLKGGGQVEAREQVFVEWGDRRSQE